MSVLKSVLWIMFCGLAVYTAAVVIAEGPDLVSVFLGDIFAMNWSGQFNLDFLCYLVLSAFWVAWRHGFSGGGLALAAVASVGGVLFFAPYLLIQSARVASIRELVLGVHARS